MHQIMHMSNFLPREDTEELHSLIVRTVDPRSSWEALSLKAVFMTTCKILSRSDMVDKLQDLQESINSLLEKRLFCSPVHLTRVFKLLVARSYQLGDSTKVSLIKLQCRMLETSQKPQTVSQLITLLLYDRMLHGEHADTRELIASIEQRLLDGFGSLAWSEQVRALWAVVAGIGFTKPHSVDTSGCQVSRLAESYHRGVLEYAKPRMEQLR
jgi:hypothetical protein